MDKFNNLRDFSKWLKSGATEPSFLRGLITKWYLLIAVPGVYAAYNFFSHPTVQGVLNKAEQIVRNTTGMALRVTENCTPLITDFVSFISCIQNQ
ncbi:MAG: hypothetical protein J0H68_01340 [Sphingobacteriia bacterium]|nr:hypothetical protein [Sphingobacteriia bacterium]